MQTAELVKSVSVTNMVNQRAAMMARLEQACALIQEAATIAEAAHLGMPRMMVSRDFGRHTSEVHIAAARIKADHRGQPWGLERSPQAELDRVLRLGVDCAAWQYLMQESGLRSLMDAKARETWDKSIADGEVPEFTEANVRSTFGMLHDARGDMFERGVVSCFKSLAWDYKTNLPQKFGKRIVMRFLRGSIQAKWGSGTSLGHPNLRSTDALDDLSRVLSVLDGKVEPDSARRGWYGRLLNCDRVGAPDAEDDYIRVRSFRNGNGHATFKRPDLVDRMNVIIARHFPNALPAPKA